MMKASIVIIGAFMIGVISPQEIDSIVKFKGRVDSYDITIYNQWFTNQNAMEFWKIGDEALLSLLNNELKDQSPSLYFKNIPDEYINDINVRANDSGGFSITYKPHRPPGDAAQAFRISVNPLDGKEPIYIARYSRDWWLGPNCEGSLIVAGTFRIIGRKGASGNFELLAKFEESNFYERIILKQQFKNYTGEIQPPYMWCPSIDLASVRQSNDLINFDTSFGFSMIGYPPKSNMKVSWKYDGRQNKLQALEYLYHPYSLQEPNLKIDLRMGKGEPVPIPE